MLTFTFYIFDKNLSTLTECTAVFTLCTFLSCSSFNRST